MNAGWVWLRNDGAADVAAENERLHAVLGHCPRSIAVLDSGGVLVGYNREFAALFHTPPQVGEPVARLFEEGPRAMLAEVVSRAGTAQRAGALIPIRARGGDERDVEFLVATIPGDGDRSVGVVMAGDDRTAHLSEETERLSLTRLVGEANADDAISLGQAALCHDLSNALTIATLSMEQLRAATAADPRTLELVKELDQAIRFAVDLVGRARAEARQKFVPRADVADLGECAARAVRVVSALAPRSRVAIALEVRSTCTVALGQTDVTRVLTNLLTNSLHAIEDAGRPGRIDVLVDCAPPTGAVTVRDDGIGIEPSALLNSFEAFQTTRAAKGGTGLGLGIARTLVEAAGGRIDVLSSPGHSTMMRIELPSAAPDAPDMG